MSRSRGRSSDRGRRFDSNCAGAVTGF
jgi:hypothetical protein